MLPPVKPDLVVFDYHQTLLDSPHAQRDEKAEFYPDALEFLNDLRIAGIRSALVSLGTDARPVHEKLEPLKAWDLFAHHRFPHVFLDMDIYQAKQSAFRDILRDVTKELGREPVVWFIGDKGRDFSHFGNVNHFNIAVRESSEAYEDLDPNRKFFMVNFAEARQELAVLLKPEGLSPTQDLG